MAEASLVEAATGRFKSATAKGQDWGTTAKACLDSLGLLPSGANLGILYATDLLAEDLGSIVTFLRERTGIADWVGTVGLGVAAAGPGDGFDDEGALEIYDEPALAVMVCALPEEGFRLLPPLLDAGSAPLEGGLAGWAEAQEALLGLVHADPRSPQVPDIIAGLSRDSGAYLIGGLSSSRGRLPQFAGRESEGGVSGLLFGPDCPLLVGLTQGCSPIGPRRTITRAEGSRVEEIDGRPAFEVFKEDIGELLAHDLRRVAGYIFAGLPIPGSDGDDYLVRNLTALDPEHGWIGIGDQFETGQPLVFCRRDGAAAIKDLDRMLKDLLRRAGETSGGRPQAALYISCIARGVNLFGPKSAELKQVSAALGDIPLVGFFANGEICNDRLYGYTGVLALFV